jgi:hypothetical protein
MKLFGTGIVDRRYPDYHSDLRTPPNFLWQPPPPSPMDVIGMKMVVRQSDRIAYLPGCVGEGQSSDIKERYS